MSVKKNNGRFSINAFDVFVIILVLALIATIVYKAVDVINIGSVSDKKDYTVVFYAQDEYNTLENYLKNGDNVYLCDSGIYIGTIEYYMGEDVLYENIESDSSEAGSQAPTGEYYKTNYYGRIKLCKDAYDNENGYITVEGFNIAKGAVLRVRTDKTEFEIKVTDILAAKN